MVGRAPRASAWGCGRGTSACRPRRRRSPKKRVSGAAVVELPFCLHTGVGRLECRTGLLTPHIHIHTNPPPPTGKRQKQQHNLQQKKTPKKQAAAAAKGKGGAKARSASASPVVASASQPSPALLHQHQHPPPQQARSPAVAAAESTPAVVDAYREFLERPVGPDHALVSSMPAGACVALAFLVVVCRPPLPVATRHGTDPGDC